METSNPTNFNVRQARTEVTTVQMTPTGSYVLDVGGQITSFAVLHNDDQGILPRVCKEDNMGRSPVSTRLWKGAWLAPMKKLSLYDTMFGWFRP